MDAYATFPSRDAIAAICMACPAAIKEYASAYLSAYLMIDSDARLRLPHRSLTI
jgi:hypothetical protein